MKSIATLIAAANLLATLATAQPLPHYTVTDLNKTLPDGWSSAATFVSDNGIVTGIATAPDHTQHAVLWQGGKIVQIDKRDLNSGAFGVNERGQATVQSETKDPDPNNENFCAYNTGKGPSLKCLPFVWQDGVLTQLRPLKGGVNGAVGTINSRGEVVGIAENGTRDPDCPPGVAFTGAGPQVLNFQAVIWGPNGEPRVLPPLKGDTVGLAVFNNDNGQAAGASGKCSNTVLPPIAFGPHLVLWERDGSAVDLGSLGGTVNREAGVGHMSLAINNRGQVAGISAIPGDPAGTPSTASHAFLWTREKIGIDCAPTGLNGCMRDLGTLEGDFVSVGLGINDRGEVVGLSIGEQGLRGFFWQNGVMTDLNKLVTPRDPTFTLQFPGINSRGEIAGSGMTSTGETHAFLATRAPTGASAGPKNTTVIARQITLDGTASFSADGKPLTYLWSIPQGSPSAAILHGTTATPEVQFASGRNAYIFQLTVTDSTGTSATELTTVNFQGN